MSEKLVLEKYCLQVKSVSITFQSRRLLNAVVSTLNSQSNPIRGSYCFLEQENLPWLIYSVLVGPGKDSSSIYRSIIYNCLFHNKTKKYISINYNRSPLWVFKYQNHLHGTIIMTLFILEPVGIHKSASLWSHVGAHRRYLAYIGFLL